MKIVEINGLLLLLLLLFLLLFITYIRCGRCAATHLVLILEAGFLIDCEG